MTRRFLATVEVDLEVTVHNDSVIDRVVNNEASWRETFYNMTTAEDVIEMLAYNYVVNAVGEISGLDGWADLPGGTVTFRDIRSDVSNIEEEEYAS